MPFLAQRRRRKGGDIKKGLENLEVIGEYTHTSQLNIIFNVFASSNYKAYFIHFANHFQMHAAVSDF